MRSALGKWYNMVDLFSRRQCTSLFTKLAQWVSSDILVAYTYPSAAVVFLGGRIALVAVIPSGLLLGMLLTEAAVGQPWAAGVGARTLWLAGHDTNLLA